MPCGPTMIPPTSSSTIAGTRIAGAMARISGARKAITATITKLVYASTPRMVAMEGDGVELPIFELPVVILPGELLPLHIFEERYKRMIGHCLETAEPFGIVFRDEGGNAHRIGCMARVTEVLERFEDGRMNIVVAGEQPFRSWSASRNGLPRRRDRADRLRGRARRARPGGRRMRARRSPSWWSESRRAARHRRLEAEDSYGIAARVELPAGDEAGAPRAALGARAAADAGRRAARPDRGGGRIARDRRAGEDERQGDRRLARACGLARISWEVAISAPARACPRTPAASRPARPPRRARRPRPRSRRSPPGRRRSPRRARSSRWPARRRRPRRRRGRGGSAPDRTSRSPSTPRPRGPDRRRRRRRGEPAPSPGGTPRRGSLHAMDRPRAALGLE